VLEAEPRKQFLDITVFARKRLLLLRDEGE
jgi:hypothetical protein